MRRSWSGIPQTWFTERMESRRVLILTDTLELETLDFPEVQASVESLQMAASSHMERIKALASTGQEV